MSELLHDINDLSTQTLQVMMAVLQANDQQQRIPDNDAGPTRLASSLSDYFQVTASLEAKLRQNPQQQIDPAQLTELGDYGLDLLDRLARLVHQLAVHEQRHTLAAVYASLGLWLAQRGATLNNLEGIADGFARLATFAPSATLETLDTGNPADEQKAYCAQMEEIVAAASESLQADTERDNPLRPWRILNLNIGTAATSSLDPALIEDTFEKLGKRLPEDMPGYLLHTRMLLDKQQAPGPVIEVVNRYLQRWPMQHTH